MLEKLKSLLIQTISFISMYEIAILLGCFFLFIMIFTLGLLLRGRKFIARFFFFLSALVIIGVPIALHLLMKDVLYKSEITITNAHPMQYTKGFFVAGSITNNGKIAFNECVVSVNEVRKENNKLMPYLNALFPKSHFEQKIELDVKVGEAKEFATIVQNFSAKEPFLYQIYVDCYVSNKLYQKLQGKAKPDISIVTPTMPKAEVEAIAESGSADENDKSAESSQDTQEAQTNPQTESNSGVDSTDTAESSEAKADSTQNTPNPQTQVTPQEVPQNALDSTPNANSAESTTPQAPATNQNIEQEATQTAPQNTPQNTPKDEALDSAPPNPQ